MIQFADFIAGTLGYIYDESKKSEYSERFLKEIEPIVASLNFFPTNFSFEELKKTNTDEKFNPTIARMSLLRIQDFLERTKGDTQEKIDQINFLKLLLLFQRIYYKSKYISTKEIFRHLNKNRPKNLKEEYFRSKVVGKLRDKGILISSSRKGYKIPINRDDLESFITHGNQIILPMLNRIKTLRDSVKLGTDNSLDILDNFSELKKLIE